MTLNPANFDNCNIKNTCLGGVNDGVAYDPADPCPDCELFDQEACDCYPDPACGDWVSTWSRPNLPYTSWQCSPFFGEICTNETQIPGGAASFTTSAGPLPHTLVNTQVRVGNSAILAALGCSFGQLQWTGNPNYVPGLWEVQDRFGNTIAGPLTEYDYVGCGNCCEKSASFLQEIGYTIDTITPA